MARKTEPDRDLVEELHEDAKWSMWTNTLVRWRIGRRHPLPSDPGIGTFLLAALMVGGVIAGVVTVIALLLR